MRIAMHACTPRTRSTRRIITQSNDKTRLGAWEFSDGHADISTEKMPPLIIRFVNSGSGFPGQPHGPPDSLMTPFPPPGSALTNPLSLSRASRASPGSRPPTRTATDMPSALPGSQFGFHACAQK